MQYIEMESHLKCAVSDELLAMILRFHGPKFRDKFLYSDSAVGESVRFSDQHSREYRQEWPLLVDGCRHIVFDPEAEESKELHKETGSVAL